MSGSADCSNRNADCRTSQGCGRPPMVRERWCKHGRAKGRRSVPQSRHRRPSCILLNSNNLRRLLKVAFVVRRTRLDLPGRFPPGGESTQRTATRDQSRQAPLTGDRSGRRYGRKLAVPAGANCPPHPVVERAYLRYTCRSSGDGWSVFVRRRVGAGSY